MVTKSIKYFLSFITISLFVTNSTFAQSKFEIYLDALELFDEKKYTQAIPLFKKVLTTQDSVDAIPKLAECLRLTNNFKEAEYYYSKLARKEYAEPYNELYYALCLKMNGKFTESHKWYSSYFNRMPEDLSVVGIISALQTYLDSSDKITCKKVLSNATCKTFNAPVDIILPSDLTYQWIFDDGDKQSGNQVEHCFSGPGKYKILRKTIERVTGFQKGADTTFTVYISDYPAYFSCPDKDRPGFGVVFDGRKSAKPNAPATEYFWDFGDGSPIQFGSMSLHKYDQPGKYLVKLTVTFEDTDSKDRSIYCATREIEISTGYKPGNTLQDIQQQGAKERSNPQ